MRIRCRQTCTNTSLFIYVSAVVLFAVCNVLAMMLIQRHIWNKGGGPDAAVAAGAAAVVDDVPFDSKDGVLIEDLMRNFPFTFNRTKFRTDRRRHYFIHDSVVVGNAWTTQSSLGYVTLATQSSVDRLHWLLEVSESWKAPISVSVFVPGIDYYIAKVYIAYLRLCSPVIRTNVTFHFVYHRDMAPQESISYPKHYVPSCTRSAEALPLVLRYRTSSFRRWWQQALYPQNHLRNAARQGCLTTYHFLTDIDIIPVPGLANDLQRFLGKEDQRICRKCVYVVPTYEMPEKLPIPNSKAEMIERVKRKQGRPFHAKVFIHNQYATNHTLWETSPDPGFLEAAYKIKNYEFFYEPFYIARSDVPLYDERFIGYGFTRNTQVFEMYLAGYELWVLNPAFAVHKGVQSRRGRGAWRERQNVMNRKQFVRFKNEMAIKYKTSSKNKST